MPDSPTPPPQGPARRFRTRATLTLVGVFLLGGLTGSAATVAAGVRMGRRILSGSPALLEARLRLLAMRVGLRLSREQATQLTPLLERYSVERYRVRRRSRAEYTAIRDRERDELRPLLSPEQRRKFDDYFAAWDESISREDKAVPP